MERGFICPFLSDAGIPGFRYMIGLDVVLRFVVDFIDVTLVDEDTNSIPTVRAHRAILGNLEMKVAPHGG